LDSPDGVEIIRDGCALLNFASNDYLGLSQHPKVKEAAVSATEQFGAGAGASRLICGSLAIHHELEELIARFKGTEAALNFSTGYAAAVGTICSLVSAGDIVIVDKLVHASLVDGARLSGAKLRVFRHNDLADLASLLEWAEKHRKEKAEARVLIVTESVFSMDGDCAQLREIVDLKKRFGAWLMVDEAHALGVLGPKRRGLAEELNLGNQIEVQMGTLGKAAGAAGGFIAGSKILVDHLINSARSFIFSTAPTPATAAAAMAGLKIIASEEGESLRTKLVSNIRQLAGGTHSVPIIPIHLGDEARAVAVSESLLGQGLLVPAIRYPTVARGKARLRVTLSAAHTPEQIDKVGKAIRDISH
jgi:8-amino-7-oxononanoate synthase